MITSFPVIFVAHQTRNLPDKGKQSGKRKLL